MAGKQDARNDATSFTKAANDAVKDRLPPHEQAGYEQARKGLIAQVEDLVIEGPSGPVWSLTAYLGQMPYPPPPACPDTVNPSLWRMATLNSVAGLFEVTPGIYQVRAFDMSNMTIIESNIGIVIIDPLISTECAAAALALFRKHRPQSGMVRGVIYTHSHVDHFGGVAGVIDDPRSVEILAPAGFMEHAVSENVYAGVAMARRAQYMYGPYLKPGNKGQIDCGLGKGQSTGTISLLKPTIDITTTGQRVEIDGLEIVFQMTPGSEAPAEMNFYFPKYKALCTAENTTHNMHNIQTLRGARVRDALLWSKYLNEAISMFCINGHTDVLFAQHHWPVWGMSGVQGFLSKQRDMYRYLNDQTLRLLNKGYTGIEIAETFELPQALEQDWSCRGYYGSVSHNVKGVYDRYMGWFNGNPATLHALPPTRSAPKYVEAMGGAEAVIEKARAAFDKGEYRWAAELVGHVVFDSANAKPLETKRAKDLQADALEQLGYQSEPATWRNFYLMGAQELRTGIQDEAPIFSPDLSVQLTNEMIFDLLGSRLDGPNAAKRNLAMDWIFTDMPADDKQNRCRVEVSSGALSCGFANFHAAVKVDVIVRLERSALDQVMIGEKSLEEVIAEGRIQVEKGLDDLVWFFSLIEDGDPSFPIVTPKTIALPDMKPGARGVTAAVDTVKQRRWGFAPPVLKGC